MENETFHPDEEAINIYLADPGAAPRSIKEHIGTCPDCKAEVENWEKMMRESRTSLMLEPDRWIQVRSGIFNRINDKSVRPFFLRPFFAAALLAVLLVIAFVLPGLWTSDQGFAPPVKEWEDVIPPNFEPEITATMENAADGQGYITQPEQDFSMIHLADMLLSEIPDEEPCWLTLAYDPGMDHYDTIEAVLTIINPINGGTS